MAVPMPGTVMIWTCGEAGSLAKAAANNFRKAFLGLLALTDLGREFADQSLGHGTAQRRDRLVGGLVARAWGLLA